MDFGLRPPDLRRYESILTWLRNATPGWTAHRLGGGAETSRRFDYSAISPCKLFFNFGASTQVLQDREAKSQAVHSRKIEPCKCNQAIRLVQLV